MVGTANQVILVLWAIFLSSFSPIYAEVEESLPVFVDEGDSAAFYYGMSCAILSELSSRDVQSLVDKSNAEFFPAFCRPENLYVCADYSSLLHGFGTLEENSSHGDICRFVSRREGLLRS